MSAPLPPARRPPKERAREKAEAERALEVFLTKWLNVIAHEVAEDEVARRRAKRRPRAA